MALTRVNYSRQGNFPIDKLPSITNDKLAGSIAASKLVTAARADTIIAATGGTITTDGDFKVHTFTSSGNFVISSVAGKGEVRVLCVAGGGGGGFKYGGGGGAGGFVEDTYIFNTGTFVVTIGSGGSGRGAANHTASAGIGGDSYINPTDPASIDGADFTIIARGGGCAGPGGSGSYTTVYFNNEDGGSGAGTSGVTQGSSYVNTPSWGSNSGTGSQGSGGGCGVSYGGSATFTGGGGGGGAGHAGNTAPQGGGPIGSGGVGGLGRDSTITGSVTTYGGGGGGGYGSWASTSQVSGGNGGGGAGARTGVAGTNGTANTGGGGGGGAGSTYTSGYNGGSGIVIFRYRFQ